MHITYYVVTLPRKTHPKIKNIVAYSRWL